MVKSKNKKAFKTIMIFLIVVFVMFGVIWFELDYYQTQSVASSSSSDYAGANSEGETVEGGSGNFFSIIDNTCSPSSGYDICYQNTAEEGQARAKTRIETTESPIPVNGEIKGANYYVGPSILPVKFQGDKFYLYDARKIDNWNDFSDLIDCDENGCYNYEMELPEEYELSITDIGEQYTGCPVFVAWDYDYVTKTSSSGDYTWWWWSWGTTYSGWLDFDNDNKCLDIKSVVCYDDNDCANGYMCDTSGYWDEFSCIPWECTDDETKCENTDFYSCSDNLWVNKGKVAGQCSIECITDIDCAGSNYLQENKCVDGDLKNIIGTGVCTDSNLCEISINHTLTKNCILGCNNDECYENSPVVILIILGLIGIVGGIIYWIFKKN